MITTDIATALDNAEAKALATTGPHGVNVVPVSVLEWTDAGEILLYDFFMGKTVENVHATPEVALTAWTGLTGVQVKATAAYITEGDLFATKEAEMKIPFPDRTLRGVLVLRPTTAYDVSAGAEAGQQLVGHNQSAEVE